MLWEFGFVLLFLAPQAAGVKESDARPDLAVRTDALGSVRLAELLKASTHARAPGFDLGRPRAKRSVFLHSGVKICPQETMGEVVASHRAYYQLRVCQEAVWEAFRIFFDRIPGTAEYQRWVHTCQHESLCISDLAKNFSSSEEHMRMIHRRLNRMRDGRPPSRGSVTPAPTQRVPETAGPELQTDAPSAASPLTTGSTTSTWTTLDQTQPAEEAEEDSELLNVVPVSPVEQTVDFSIDLVDPGYRELLDDPDSPQYVDLSQHLQDQMQHVFDKLPGFKAIHVLRIRPGGISVRYSLVFENNSPQINSEKSETAAGSLREMVTKALREEASLPIDLDSLNFGPEAVLPAPTSTSSTEVVSESSEPDSHNEFEVSRDEPEVDKPQLVVPLTPMEKENALVTLLDPTAVPLDETKAVTGGVAESTDHPPASEDITDKAEAIYVSSPEPSNAEGGEEELLIITYEIETIHHNETGELVRDYVPTPLVVLDPATAPPYISLSPSQVQEEDLTPVDEDDKTPSLDLTPTTQALLTTAPAGEELSDLGLQVTALSAITGQPPTEPTVTLQEDEEVNALPDEEEVDMGVPELHRPVEDVSKWETGAELLETEGQLVVVPEDVLDILQPKPDVSEPAEENVEVSELDTEDKIVVVSEPEKELENQELVSVSEPEEMVNVEVSDPVEVSEPEAEPDETTVDILTPGGVDVLQTDKETIEVTEAGKEIPELAIGLDEVLHPGQGPEPNETSEMGEDVDKVSEDDESEEAVPEVTKETIPAASKPEAVDVLEGEEVGVFPEPEDKDVEMEEKVVEISKVEENVTEAPVPGEPYLLEPKSEPESASGEQSYATEPSRIGTEDSESAEGTPKVVSEPSETRLEIAQEPKVVEDAEQEEEVRVGPIPDTEPAAISEPQLLPEDEAGKREVFDNPEPEEASEPREGTIDVLSPGEELPGGSELEPKEDVVGDLPELHPEEGIVGDLEPEPGREISRPPAESIKVLHPLDGMENQFGDETVQVVEDNNFLQPVEPDYHHPSEEDNLLIIPVDIPSDVGEPDHENPVIEDFYPEEDVDSVESGDVAEATSPDKQDTSEGTEVTEGLPEETEESDSSPERDTTVTAAPVSAAFLTPPAKSVGVSEVSSPSPTIDAGLFEVAEESVIPAAPESSEDDRVEPEAEWEQNEPAVVIIDEDLEKAVQKRGESQTSSPVATEEVIDEAVKDLTVELDQTDVTATEANELPDEGSGFLSVDEDHTTVTVAAPPPVRYLTTPSMTTASHGREIVVFFSVRVTNMAFSENLFNKTSSEYRSLENTFLDVLLPYLQANLTGFKKLEILNFRKGSVVVNSQIKFNKSVPYNITEAVHCVLEEFCSAAAQKMHIQIDTHSLDIEPADQADPCKFLACDGFSRCVVNSWTKEARCLCEPGFVSVDGLPCQSVCVLQPDYCRGGRCHVEPGRGAVCRLDET